MASAIRQAVLNPEQTAQFADLMETAYLLHNPTTGAQWQGLVATTTDWLANVSTAVLRLTADLRTMPAMGPVAIHGLPGPTQPSRKGVPGIPWAQLNLRTVAEFLGKPIQFGQYGPALVNGVEVGGRLMPEWMTPPEGVIDWTLLYCPVNRPGQTLRIGGRHDGWNPSARKPSAIGEVSLEPGTLLILPGGGWPMTALAAEGGVRLDRLFVTRDLRAVREKAAVSGRVFDPWNLPGGAG